MHRIRLVAVLATASIAGIVPAACTSSVPGQGSAGPGGSAAGGSSTPDFPSPAAGSTPSPAHGTGTAPVGSGSAAPGSAAPGSAGAASGSPAAVARPKATITVTGTSTGTVYVARVYLSDTVTDCVAHAYGAKMLAFLRAHPCRPPHRVLATVDDAGRTAVISMITTSFPGTGADPYAAVNTFRELEQADGTGSLNDLLREGHPVAGIATRIPPDEAFSVVGQDDGVTVFDAWWAAGSTPDQAPALLTLEQDLFLTPLTSA